MYRRTIPLILLNCLMVILFSVSPVLAASPDDIFIPFVTNRYNPVSTGRTVNVPFINASTSDVTGAHLAEMAVYWFGEVKPVDNYTDVRIAYNSTHLIIRSATFDRSLYYNENSSVNPNDLGNWDSISIAIQTAAGNAAFPGANAFRFVTGLRHWEDMTKYKRQYQGNGSGWSAMTSNFSANTTYRGELGFNVVPPAGDASNRGWEAVVAIPFSALGIGGPPSAGTIWRMQNQTSDRDTPSATGPTQVWPESGDIQSPSTWANVRFGIPAFATPPSKKPVIKTLKNNVAGISAPDAHVGGAMTCGTTQNFFDVWGSLNYAHSGDVNIQNQVDIADFPCYSRYYITFPHYTAPDIAGKIVRSARLEMSIFGGSDPDNAQPSFIQAFTITSDWNENTINWNNAPMAQENLGGTWVNVFHGPINWPTIPRYSWDVTRAVSEAYDRGQPVRLGLYSADSAYHSGKYFVSSDTEPDWNERNLPALVIEFVDP